MWIVPSSPSSDEGKLGHDILAGWVWVLVEFASNREEAREVEGYEV